MDGRRAGDGLADNWWRRLARWSRRHRTATRAAAASLAVIATVATVAALAIGREQAQTRKALERETRARLDEIKARVLAQNQSQLALDAITEYSTGVTRNFFLKQPEMANLRKSLLRAPLRFYRRLAQNIEDNGQTDLASGVWLAQAQLELGRLMSDVGSVEDTIATLEQTQDSLVRLVRRQFHFARGSVFAVANARRYLAHYYDRASRPADAPAGFLTRR